MTFPEIEAAARATLREHGLTDVEFTWGRGKTVLGQALEQRRDGVIIGRTLKLSKVLMPMIDDAMVIDTIRHEVAHLLAGVRAGHGPAWKRAARRLGANPERVAHLPEEIKRRLAKYEIACDRCGMTVYLQRRLKADVERYRHKGCGGRMALKQ